MGFIYFIFLRDFSHEKQVEMIRYTAQHSQHYMRFKSGAMQDTCNNLYLKSESLDTRDEKVPS